VTDEQKLNELRERIYDLERGLFDVNGHPVRLLTTRGARDELIRIGDSEDPNDVQTLDIALQRWADAGRITYGEAYGVFSETVDRARELNRLDDEGLLDEGVSSFQAEVSKSTSFGAKTVDEAEAAATQRVLAAESKGSSDMPAPEQRFSRMSPDEWQNLHERVLDLSAESGISYSDALARITGETAPEEGQ
jgi:hypothetical protein